MISYVGKLPDLFSKINFNSALKVAGKLAYACASKVTCCPCFKRIGNVQATKKIGNWNVEDLTKILKSNQITHQLLQDADSAGLRAISAPIDETLAFQGLTRRLGDKEYLIKIRPSLSMDEALYVLIFELNNLTRLQNSEASKTRVSLKNRALCMRYNRSYTREYIQAMAAFEFDTVIKTLATVESTAFQPLAEKHGILKNADYLEHKRIEKLGCKNYWEEEQSEGSYYFTFHSQQLAAEARYWDN